MNKSILRKRILKSRQILSNEELISKSKKVTKLLFSTPYYRQARNIMCYVDFRNEVKTEYIIKESLRNNKKTIIPISIVKTKELLLSELRDYDNELSPGSYNILEPKQEFIREVYPDVIDLVLVPGVAFDIEGHRLGYGGGYYDRFLSQLHKSVPKIALAFDLQIVNNITADPHDISMDYIITENTIVDCSEL